MLTIGKFHFTKGHIRFASVISVVAALFTFVALREGVLTALVFTLEWLAVTLGSFCVILFLIWLSRD